MALWTVFLFPLDISLQLLKRIRAIKYFSLLRPYIILGLLSLSNLLQLQYSQRFAVPWYYLCVQNILSRRNFFSMDITYCFPMNALIPSFWFIQNICMSMLTSSFVPMNALLPFFSFLFYFFRSYRTSAHPC